MIDEGATTIWERWEGYDADGMPSQSHNHYSKGAVITFLHQYTAGIVPLEPGYRRFAIRPVPEARLDWAEATHDSPYGRIRSAWRRTDDGIVLDIEVPPGTVCEVTPPGAPAVVAGTREAPVRLSRPAPAELRRSGAPRAGGAARAGPRRGAGSPPTCTGAAPRAPRSRTNVLDASVSAVTSSGGLSPRAQVAPIGKPSGTGRPTKRSQSQRPTRPDRRGRARARRPSTRSARRPRAGRTRSRARPRRARGRPPAGSVSRLYSKPRSSAAPPTQTRVIREAIAGSSRSASATLVRGPAQTSTSGSGSSRSAAATIASAAAPVVGPMADSDPATTGGRCAGPTRSSRSSASRAPRSAPPGDSKTGLRKELVTEIDPVRPARAGGGPARRARPGRRPSRCRGRPGSAPGREGPKPGAHAPAPVSTGTCSAWWQAVRSVADQPQRRPLGSLQTSVASGQRGANGQPVGDGLRGAGGADAERLPGGAAGGLLGRPRHRRRRGQRDRVRVPRGAG